MPADSKLDQAQRRRMRYAESKLRLARIRLARSERSILYWTRVLADIRQQRIRAVQAPLWPQEEIRAED